MQITDAQQDISRVYVGGGPGLFFSALVWLAAGLVEQQKGTATGFAVLFVGGMFIFPVGLLLSRVVFRRSKETAGNPFGKTVMECTAAMIGGLFAAWLFLPFKSAFVFPLAAIAVGTHFAVFTTVYGNRLFWLLGAALTAIGVYGIFGRPAVVPVPFAVAIIEAAFAAVLTVRALLRNER